MTTTDYQKQATDFLERFGLTFKAEFIGKTCPPWGGSDRKTRHSCPKCGDVHGWEWRITIERGQAAFSFPFWNSWNDTHFQPKTTSDPHGERPLSKREYVRDGAGWVLNQPGKRTPDEWIAKPPTAYDALACISSSGYCETDFAAWCAEFGYDTDSRRAEAQHRECMALALKMRQFFTAEELEALAEIN